VGPLEGLHGFSIRVELRKRCLGAERSGAEGQTVKAGVAESLDRRGNPRSPLAESLFVRLSHFGSLCRLSVPLIASANTGITPDESPPGIMQAALHEDQQAFEQQRRAIQKLRSKARNNSS